MTSIFQLREKAQTPLPDIGFEVLAQEVNLPMGEPCQKCGCPFYYQLSVVAFEDRGKYYQMCYRCFPRSEKRGGTFSDEQVERLWKISREWRKGRNK